MLTYKAAQMVDDGRFHADEADAAYLNAAKLMSARTAVHATDHAMQDSRRTRLIWRFTRWSACIGTRAI